MSPDIPLTLPEWLNRDFAADWGGWRLEGPALVFPAYRGGGVYPVDLERLTCSARMLDAITQVAGKSWATMECVGGLVHALDDIFRWQGTLCGGGRDRHLTEDQIKHQVKNYKLKLKQKGKGFMRMVDADVIWTPVFVGTKDAGAVRVERHGSHWQRTKGDRWKPATYLGRLRYPQRLVKTPCATAISRTACFAYAY